MDRRPLTVVREQLQAYADRGVFRGFTEVRKGCFEFVWLAGLKMRLRVEPSFQHLRFKQLFPGIPARSAMYAELKDFVRQRCDPELPEHRRIDPELAIVACYNRNGFVSISMKVICDDYRYGVNRIINLVHELFLHLRDQYPGYLAENFDVPQE
jgi:hypothetical protein